MAQDPLSHEAIVNFNASIGLDDVLAQLRAGLAEIDAVLEASGCTALEREIIEIGYQEDAVFIQLRKTKPTTLAGVIAMLELAAADLEYREVEIELVEPALAGLREIAAGQRLTAAGREELAEMLAEMGYEQT
jgi:hypothetical protein